MLKSLHDNHHNEMNKNSSTIPMCFDCNTPTQCYRFPQSSWSSSKLADFYFMKIFWFSTEQKLRWHKSLWSIAPERNMSIRQIRLILDIGLNFFIIVLLVDTTLSIFSQKSWKQLLLQKLKRVVKYLYVFWICNKKNAFDERHSINSDE